MRTYARERLLTGALGVGLFVVLAVFLLSTGWMNALLATTEEGPVRQWVGLLGFLGAFALVGVPFDFLGGYWLPKKHGRPHPSLARFFVGWLRGVSTLVLLGSTIGLLLIEAGQVGGRIGSLVVMAIALVALLLFQAPLAMWIGALRGKSKLGTTRIIEATDPGFTGGMALFGKQSLVPQAWADTLEPGQFSLLRQRRKLIRNSGAALFTSLAAGGWNLVGFGFAMFAPHAGVSTVSELAHTSLAFTLWTFLGLLLLPTPSRKATLGADAALLHQPGNAEAKESWTETVERLDRWQDDEPRRAVGVERIFHPIPSLENRLAALVEVTPTPSFRAWHLARTALFLAHAGLSLIPRMVHCNVGRPELWVFLPSDG